MQDWVADDPTEGEGETYQSITCTICTRIHLVDPKTGRVLGADEDEAALKTPAEHAAGGMSVRCPLAEGPSITPHFCPHNDTASTEVNHVVQEDDLSILLAARGGSALIAGVDASLRCGLPDLRRRGRIASAKCAIEIGKITEPHIKRHRADVAIGKVWIAQDPVRARGVGRAQRREGEAFVLEELVNISWCHMVAHGDFDDRQIAVVR